MKNIQHTPLLKALIISAVSLAVSFAAIPIAFAVTPISQGYSTDGPISVGSIVSLKQGSADHVIPSTASTSDSIIGVVVNDDSSPITLNSGAASQAQVATGGVVGVIVSDVSGDIEQGDQITASNIKGVGMKATANTKVVGVAQGPMTGKSKQKIKDDKGEELEVTLGQVSVLVSVSYHYQTPDKTIIPAALQNIANTVAGKKVDSLPIILSTVVFIVMMVTVVSIIYGMVRNSIISIGRNPMAQSAVYRDVVQLSVLVIAILTVGVVAIYLILTRL